MPVGAAFMMGLDHTDAVGMNSTSLPLSANLGPGGAQVGLGMLDGFVFANQLSPKCPKRELNFLSGPSASFGVHVA
jgi:hypothetical protein